MVHNLKILDDFADAVYMKDKTFEIRKNDRGFQKGDYIRFQAIGKDGLPIKHVGVCSRRWRYRTRCSHSL